MRRRITSDVAEAAAVIVRDPIATRVRNRSARRWSVRHPKQRRRPVYVRVVRFADVNKERVDSLLARVDEAEGPPPGVSATGFQMLLDEAQGTAVVLQFFDTAEDMAASDAAFDAMDPGETPGTRTSVDRCAVAFERSL